MAEEPKPYEVKFEIAGPAAMFTRPDTGSTPISYPVPTASAVKGICDAILRRGHIFIQPTKVVMCKPIRYERYVTNYGGPLRKQGQIENNNSYQLIATILVDVCYRIYGEVRMKKTSKRAGSLQERPRSGQDWRPKFKELFDERIQLGRTYYTPCLGWKEFVPCYLGPFRSDTKRQKSVEEVIPSLLSSMWEHHVPKPEFKQDWRIVKGVMSYINQIPKEEELNVD